jgi:hypothetical protein
MDNVLLDVIRAIPQQAQRQYGTDEQLRLAMAAANKLGLYDAADVIRRLAGDDELANAADRHAKHVCTYPCEPCCEKDPEYSMELHATQPKKDWPTVKAEAKLREDWRDRRAARDFQRD